MFPEDGLPELYSDLEQLAEGKSCNSVNTKVASASKVRAQIVLICIPGLLANAN